MNKRVKITAVFLSIVLMLAAFSGCSNNIDSNDSKGTHTVIDNSGNEIEVPNEINKIVILDISPLPSVYCMLTRSAEKIVGMTEGSKNVAVNSLLSTVVPEIAEIETGFAKGENYNIEELIKLDPDVIFYRLETEADVELVSKAGIPAVAFSTVLSDGNTIDTLNQWVDLLAKVFNDDDINKRAASIIEYGKKVEADIAERVAALDEDDKLSAMIIHNYDSSGIKVAGNTFGQYYLKTDGAINATVELDTAFPQVNLEQIYAWDPDVILMNSFTSFSPEDIYDNNAVEGDDWSGLEAVKKNRIHKYPIGMYYWFPPSSDAPLGLLWSANAIYPKLFEDIDMNNITKDYYLEFYGIDLTDEQLVSIFNPTADAAFKS